MTQRHTRPHNEGKRGIEAQKHAQPLDREQQEGDGRKKSPHRGGHNPPMDRRRNAAGQSHTLHLKTNTRV